MSMTGGCLCGAVRVTLPAPVTTVDACHCGICRRLCGGGPMVALHAEGGARPAVEGEAAVRVFRSSDRAERAFCGTCGTPLWHRLIEQDFHSLAAGLFDPGAFRLESEIFIDDKPAFYDLAGERRRLTGAETVALFAGDAP